MFTRPLYLILLATMLAPPLVAQSRHNVDERLRALYTPNGRGASASSMHPMFMSPAVVSTVLPFVNGEQSAPVWNATPIK